jgi:hypothetical protein
MEFPGVSPKPSYYNLSIYSFILDKTNEEIWNLFINYFDNKVVWKFNGRIMECVTVSVLEIINFDIIIFKNNSSSHIVEIRRMSGCRYAFSKFINMFQSDLNINFDIMMNITPKLYPDNYDDYLKKAYNTILKLMEDNENTYDILSSLKNFGNIMTNHIDLENETLIKIIKKIIYICDNSIETVNIISLSTFNILLKLCNEQLREPSWLDSVKQLYDRQYHKFSDIENISEYNKLAYLQITEGIKLLTLK